MKKNWIYLILLIVVAAVAYFVVFREEDSLFGGEESHFTVTDSSAVTTLFLASKNDEQVTLRRQPKGWTVNDSFAARQDAIAFLLDALIHQKGEQPVPVSYHDYAIRKLSTNSTKIEVYAGSKKTHSFFVAREPGEGNVTYMLEEGAKRPWIVKLPLQNAFLGVRYFTALSDWRDRRILFRDAPIEKVEVMYKDSMQYSFVLDAVKKTVSGTPVFQAPLNQQRLAAYLRLLDGIYCTGFEDHSIRKDSILKYGRQMATVKIQRKGCTPDQLTIYFRPPDKGTKAALRIGNEEYDFDSFFGFVNQRDFVLLSRQNAEKMLRSYPEFFQSDAKP